MLWTPFNEFLYLFDNMGNTPTESNMGTVLVAHTSANTKATTPTQLGSGAVASDIYFITINGVGGFLAGASRRFLVDVFIDPAGGTTWNSTPIISNLAFNSPSLEAGGVWYQFPLFIPAGSSIGAKCQAETGSATMQFIIMAQGRPTHPELFRVGRYVTTFGATTASTTGVAITPGNGIMGLWENPFSDPAEDLFWWQFGFMINDVSQVARSYNIEAGWNDPAIGSPPAHMICKGMLHHNSGTGELAARSLSSLWPYHIVPTGMRIYTRVGATGTPDSNCSMVAYGVGG